MPVDIGIDFGTDSVLIYVKGKGTVLAEPSLIAADMRSGEVKAVGKEALLMKERAAESCIALVRPVKRGAVPNYGVTKKMFEYFLGKALGKRLFLRPHVAICVPCGADEEEKDILENAALFAGARDVRFVEASVAAATGAGIDIGKACGNMIIDIGGGRSDIAVISSAKTAANITLELGGRDFDEALIRYMRKKRGILISESTAEDIKKKIGTVCSPYEGAALKVKGRDLLTGIEKTVTITQPETEEAFYDLALRLAEGVRKALEMTPQRLIADIKERGAVLTGGGSLLRGLERFIEEKTGIHTVTAQDPELAAVSGT